jgi:hypothetical protein
MATPPTSFRLPPEVIARLRALAGPGESLAGVIVRAVAALETAPAPIPAADRLDTLDARVTALEAALAQCSAPVAQAPLQGSADVAQSALRRSTGVARTGSHYPVDVQRMAVRMADEGATTSAIREAVARACGRSPSVKNLGTTLKAWRREA